MPVFVVAATRDLAVPAASSTRQTTRTKLRCLTWAPAPQLRAKDIASTGAAIKAMKLNLRLPEGHEDFDADFDVEACKAELVNQNYTLYITLLIDAYGC